jgi:hypothetical protein
MHVSTPWLGASRGRLADWITQRWVRLTGRRVRLEEHPWLRGPTGGTARIGADFFAAHARNAGLVLRAPGQARGLMPRFDALRGPRFDPAAVHPRVRDFYERTSQHRLDVTSRWSPAFRPFGALLALLFSRRLQQLNVPLDALAAPARLTSDVVELATPSGELALTGWVRRDPATGAVVYVGSYSVASIPGHDSPVVKVVFPLPNGSATVLLRPSAASDGALVLESSGRAFGDPGFYFVVTRSRDEVWARPVRSFRERLCVYVDDAGMLRTDHHFSLWGIPFLHLHYRLERDASA